MSDKLYTMKTAALKATTADIRNVNAKQISLNGENIADKFLNLPDDYKKLVSRCNLPDDKNWALWGDDGNLIYMNFSDKIINGSQMFFDMPQIKSFTCDLTSLVDGSDMFSGCVYLTKFDADISSLESGEGMFQDCKLDKTSVMNIIDNLRNKNNLTGQSIITLGIDEKYATDEELLNFLGISDGDAPLTITSHGGGTWIVRKSWNSDERIGR